MLTVMTEVTQTLAERLGTQTALVDERSEESVKGCHVHWDLDNARPFACVLTQCSVEKQHNNFYVIQLLKRDDRDEFFVWYRHGRIGCCHKREKFNLVNTVSFATAKKIFAEKFFSLTRNKWNVSDLFEKFQYHAGRYDYVDMNWSLDVDCPADSTSIGGLSEPVYSVMRLIMDDKTLSPSTSKYMKSQIGVTPLGRISERQADSAYKTLIIIRNLLNVSYCSKALSSVWSRFYSKVPHHFAKKAFPLINKRKGLAEKSFLLETLSDAKCARIVRMRREIGSVADPRPMLKAAYDNMRYRLDDVTPTSDVYSVLATCVANGHGPTHDYYKLEVCSIFRLNDNKSGDDGPSSLSSRCSVGNRMMLWHGSLMTNWYGILKHGLKIAPPEAYGNGAMFGQGMYFADMVSKAANYCGFGDLQEGLLLCSEVALGEVEPRTGGGDSVLPRDGYHSVKGIGKWIPDDSGDAVDFCGVPGAKMMTGKPTTNPDWPENSTLRYNEYVVYDTEQIRPAYAVLVKYVREKLDVDST